MAFVLPRRSIHKPLLACCRSWSSGAESIVERTSKLFIGNEYVPASDGGVIQIVSPIDGQPFATIAHASSADVDRAVQSARQCFDSSSWRANSVEDRASVMKKVASILRSPSKLADFSEIETRDCGKPLTESEADISMCADIFDYYATIAPDELAPSHLEIEDSAFQSRILKEPQGVIGCISPWNFPLQQAVLKIAPALAVGCSVVVKPSPLASLTTCALGEILAEAGVPPGAVNIVTGGPPDQILVADGTSSIKTSTGQCLIDHPLLDKLSFTGSGIAGAKMLEASARRLRPTSLELGGKSAFLVFDDAEPFLDALVDWIMIGIFLCQGQVCTATSRLLVHESIVDTLTKRLMAAMDKLKVGDPMLRETQMGPVVSEKQQQGVLAAIKKAQSDGCVAHAPQLQLPSGLQSGFFVPPTILTSVSEDSSAWRDEIFGPVLAIRTFRTESEAITAANRSTYGLANAVFSADAERCSRVASKLQSGVVWENCSQPLFTNTPMGGLIGKQSGFGHEFGVAGLKDYINYKTVVSTSPGHTWNWYGNA